MSKQRAKGTAAETAVVRCLHKLGFPRARRNPLAGNKDVGDIGGLSVVIEVKNHAKMTLGPWVDETETEAWNAGADVGVVWHKRRGKSQPENWYVTMTGRAFTELLKAYEREQRVYET